MRYLKCTFIFTFQHFLQNFTLPFPVLPYLLGGLLLWISLIKSSWFVPEGASRNPQNNGDTHCFSRGIWDPESLLSSLLSEIQLLLLPRYPHRWGLTSTWALGRAESFLHRERSAAGCSYHRSSPPESPGNLERSSLRSFPLNVNSVARAPQSLTMRFPCSLFKDFSAHCCF